MAKYNIYAVAYGINPTTKESVYNLKFPTWDQCKPYVVGIEGAKYKGFLTDAEADVWLGKTVSALTEEKHDEEVTPVENSPFTFSVTMSKEFRDLCLKYKLSPRELAEYLMNNFVKEQEFLSVISSGLPWD